jgi:hypothetical protein
MRTAFTERHHGQRVATTVMKPALHALRPLPDDAVSPRLLFAVPLLTAYNPMALLVYMVFAKVEPLIVLQLHYGNRTRFEVQRKCIFLVYVGSEFFYCS